METKKKILTTEELKRQCEEAKKNYEVLNEQLKKAEQEEEDRKRAQLALEKETRKKEVDDALEKYRTLMNAYIRDYGIYTGAVRTKDIPWSFWF